MVDILSRVSLRWIFKQSHSDGSFTHFTNFFLSFIGFADQYFNVGIIEIFTMTIRSRLKIHNKIITGLTFDPMDDLFSVSYDRHICRFNNLALQGRSLVDEEHLPIHVQYCNGFLLVLTDGRQIKMLNPATLNCRKILRFDGIPRVIDINFTISRPTSLAYYVT